MFMTLDYSKIELCL